MVWPSTIHMPYRRYVVDQTLGVVDIFVEFLGLNRMQAHDFMPDSNAFRVEGGKIEYLHTRPQPLAERVLNDVVLFEGA
jgi:hypothetical protein